MTEQFANAAKGELAEVLLKASTTLKVVSAASFPTEGNFRIAIDNELLLVTKVEGTKFTVTRAQEGTAAAEHAKAEEVTHVFTVASAKLLVDQEIITQLVSVDIHGALAGDDPAITVLDNVPENYGAKRDGVTNDTESFEKCEEQLEGKGGIIRLARGTYIIDGLLWSKGVKYEGRSQAINGTVIKAKKNSTKLGVIELDSGTSGNYFGGWKNIWFSPDTTNETREGLPPQDCFYLAVTEEGIPGVNNAEFENINIGTTSGLAWAGNCMWFRAGAVGSSEAHQYISFRNVKMARKNTGTYAKTSRCLKCTGQNNKFEFDGASYPGAGSTTGEEVGTNIELNCEFIKSTTLTAEALAGATTIEVGSITGLTEAQKKFELGEGSEGEVLFAEKVEGKVVTLKAGTSLARKHVVGEYVKPNSGTVAAPAAKASAHFEFNIGTYQNADLHILCGEGSLNINFNLSDFEEQHKIMLVRQNSYQCNLHDVKLNGASEGIQQGTGVLTVGSKTVTSVNTAWVNGDIINGRGIPVGTTVASGGGTTTIELSAAVTSALGSATLAMTGVPLVKGGEGGGYIAKYEKNSQGVVTYHSTGAVDNTVINDKEGGARHVNISRGAPLMHPLSTGVTLALGTAEKLAVQNARDIVLTNASTTIKFFTSIHATGEILVIRAGVAGAKFESTGNIYLQGATKIELQLGGTAIFQRTDYPGAQTWALLSYTQPVLEPQTFLANGTYNIPLAAKFIRCIVIAGGGGGGGAGSAAAAQLQAGGGGGAAGTASIRVLEVGAATTAAIVVGAGGAGGAGSSAGGAAGTEGEIGKTSSAEVGAEKAVAIGGMKGGASTASSTTRGTGGVYGTALSSATVYTAGSGGNSALGAGGSPSGSAAGGGGGGGAATATNGGGGGGGGTPIAGGAVGAGGASGTSAGVEGGSAAANTGGGGGGGGGGAAGTGAGGKGGNGGSGLVMMEPMF